MKHFSFRLAVINACPMHVPSELLLSTDLGRMDSWVHCWLEVGPKTEFEPTRVDLTGFETQRLNHSATSLYLHMKEKFRGTTRVSFSNVFFNQSSSLSRVSLQPRSKTVCPIGETRKLNSNIHQPIRNLLTYVSMKLIFTLTLQKNSLPAIQNN